MLPPTRHRPRNWAPCSPENSKLWLPRSQSFMYAFPASTRRTPSLQCPPNNYSLCRYLHRRMRWSSSRAIQHQQRRGASAASPREWRLMRPDQGGNSSTSPKEGCSECLPGHNENCLAEPEGTGAAMGLIHCHRRIHHQHPGIWRCHY